MNKKNVLIISPYFTPYQGVGALRMTSLFNYIKTKQDNVYVLKASNNSYGKKYEGMEEKEAYVVDINLSNSNEVKNKIFDVASKIIQEKKIEVAVVSFGPFDGVVQAIILLKKKYNIKLIIDYRDFWLNNNQSRSSIRGWLEKKKSWLLNKNIEKNLLSIADCFVCVTPYMEKIMINRHPEIANKSKIIFNGFTRIELEKCKEKSGYFDICILGKFSYYSAKRALKLLKAVKELNEDGMLFRIIHIGSEEQFISKVIKKDVLLRKIYVGYGQIEYAQAMNIAAKCNVFALIEKAECGIATKVFDYVYMNKPIIAIIPKGSEVNKVFGENNNLLICNNKTILKEKLKEISLKKISCFTKDTEFIDSFSREYQNEKFYEIIGSV